MLFSPNYLLADIGSGGQCLWTYNLRIHSLKLLTLHCGEAQTVVETPANPYRDLQYGGTVLGLKGRNYWVSDHCLAGKLLRLLIRKGGR